jgi:prolyl 4-hydroxylase
MVCVVMPGSQGLALPRIISIEPRVALIDEFLTWEECQHFKQTALHALQQSTVVDNDTGESVPFEHRTSFGMFFERAQDEVIHTVEQRIAQLVNMPLANQEPFQILHYGPGQEYRPHFDYFDPALKGSHIHLDRGGQRLATLIMYLNDVEQGGDTSFPELGIRTIPKTGRALLFYSVGLNGEPDPLTLHGGDAVIQGEKWIATCWIRQREFI